MRDRRAIFAELDALLQQTLGEPLNPGMWKLLDQLQHVDRVVREESGVEVLVDRVLEIQSHSGRNPDRRLKQVARGMVQDPDSLSEMADARAVLLACEAEKDEAVNKFRTTVLKNRLLKSEQITGWVQEQQRKDGPPSTRFLTLLLSADVQMHLDPSSRQFSVHPDCPISKAGQVTRLQWKSLQYPSEGWVNRIPTAADGRLEELRVLSERLSETYGWQPTQATAFVLTGGIPMIEQIRATFNTLVGSQRIVLEVDARTPPVQVEVAYKRARAGLLQGKSRVRQLTKSRLQLVIFVAQRPQDTWAQRFRTWNRMHPRKRYSAEANMRRDYTRARQSLLHPLGSPEEIEQTGWDQLVERVTRNKAVDALNPASAATAAAVGSVPKIKRRLRRTSH